MATLCTLQLARAADAEAIANMSRWVIEAGLQPTWPAHRVLWHIRDRESTVLTARNDSLVGFAIMHFGDTTAHLNLLAVLPGRQRGGIGRQMLRWLEDSARTAGTFLIRLEVRESNHGARAFYSSLGYREIGVVGGYYQGRDNAVRMSRDLRTAA
jgi:ribosomal-protein-alanine N-acetyltransferase